MQWTKGVTWSRSSVCSLDIFKEDDHSRSREMVAFGFIEVPNGRFRQNSLRMHSLAFLIERSWGLSRKNRGIASNVRPSSWWSSAASWIRLRYSKNVARMMPGWWRFRYFSASSSDGKSPRACLCYVEAWFRGSNC
jgi:hypothetical protein